MARWVTKDGGSTEGYVRQQRTMDEDGTVEQLCEYADARALDGRRVRWCVGVGDEVEVGTVLARCTLPSMSPGLEGASTVEIRSGHKGTLVRQLLREGEVVAETGPRHGECVTASALFGPWLLLLLAAAAI